MNAIILAAGRGSRMGAATQDRPKCLTPLKGKALLDWQMEALKAAGIEKIAAVRGYQSEMIRRPGLEAFENPLWSQTNMLASLMRAAPWLKAGDCLVSYGDIVCAPQTLKTLADHKGDICVAYDRQWLRLWKARFENPLSDAETFKLNPDGSIAEIGRKTGNLADIQGQYMGLLKFTAQGWNRVEGFLASRPPEETAKSDMTSLLQRLILAGFKLDTAAVDGGWLEVDNENDLNLYEKTIAVENNAITRWPGE